MLQKKIEKHYTYDAHSKCCVGDIGFAPTIAPKGDAFMEHPKFLVSYPRPLALTK